MPDDEADVYGDYDDGGELAEPMDFVDEFGGRFGEFNPAEGDDDDEGGLSSFTVWELVEHCVEPTVSDAARHTGRLLLWCLLFRVLSQALAPAFSSGKNGKAAQVNHLLSASLGLVVLWNFFGRLLVHQVALTALSYPALYLGSGRRGLVAALVCFAYNLLCEAFAAEPIDWHQIRGAQMILSMKVISLGFDMDAFKPTAAAADPGHRPSGTDATPINDKASSSSRQRGGPMTRSARKEAKAKAEIPAARRDNAVHDLLASPPSVPAYFGYALCPGTAVFGPWIKFTDYLNIFEDPVWDLAWALKIVFTLTFSMLFLTISTCWNAWLIPDNSWKWWIAYRDAMSFRASHYFVSYVGEAVAVAAGFGRGDPKGGRDDPADGTAAGGWNGVLITKPHDIEVPRSLLDVVVSWNVPMHRWLKTYCFRTTLPRFGGFVAVLVTYTASVVLHGLNFQLGAVLFSLGFYTFTEHSLRRRLSLRFDASVAAKRDPKRAFRYREGHAGVVLVNFFFGLLACFHLAYLGVMFNQQEDIMAEGYSWRHTLAKWEALNYASHIVVSVTFLLVWVL